MNDKLNKCIDKEKIHIPQKFNQKFEETLDSLPEKVIYKKSIIYKRIASIACAFVITTGVAIAISNKVYKYMPTNGAIFSTDSDIYGLEKTITKKDSSGENVELDMFINTESNRAIIQTNGKFNTPQIDKAELKIGDKAYKNKRTNLSEYKYTWGVVDVFEDVKNYNTKDEITYTMYIDENNKVDFNIKLKEMDGVANYSDLGIISKDKNVQLNAIVNEYDDHIIIDFFNILEDYSSVIAGKDSIDDTFTNIYVIDSNNKKELARREISSGGVNYNRVKINTKGLKKPYKLIVPELSVGLYKENNIACESEEIKIKIPKNGETVQLDKEIEMNFTENIIDTGNNKVKLIKGYRNDNKFIVQVEYSENKTENDKIANILAYKKAFTKKDKLIWVKSSFDENDNIIHTLEFDINPLQKSIKFKISPDTYNLSGNWNFTIK